MNFLYKIYDALCVDIFEYIDDKKFCDWWLYY